MKLSLLYNLLDKHACHDLQNAMKVYSFINELHTHDINYELSHIELFQLVSKLDLFKKDYNTPPSLRFSGFIKALRHHVAEEILGNALTEYNEEQILQVLAHDRDAQHILQGENFTILCGMGKKAAYFASCLMTANGAHLTKDCINLLKQTLLSNTDEIAARMECCLNTLKHCRALNEKNVTLLLNQPSILLANGLASLSQAGINEPINFNYLLQNPEQATYLADGFVQLHRNNLLDEENRMILARYSNDAFSLAHVFCQFNELGILQNYKPLLLQNARYAHLISQLIDYLKKSPAITNLVQDIDLILSQPERMLLITQWLCKLDENNQVTEENFKKLCENSALLDQYSIRSAFFSLMSKSMTRHNYKDWVVNLTQDRFDHVITLCINAQGDHDKAADTISNYLKELSAQQKTSHAQQNIASNQTFFRPATNNRHYQSDARHATKSKNFPDPFS